MPEEMQEEMFCFTMGDCELHRLLPTQAGRQLKQCVFMNTSVHLTSMSIKDDQGGKHAFPCLVLSNDDYDADQGNDVEEKLPITEELIFMRYSTGEDGNVIERDEDGNETCEDVAKVGYVFYYPEINECKILECEPDKTKELRAELDQFQQWVCRVLYIINERKPLRASSRSRAVLAEQDKRVANYCINAQLSVLLEQKVVGDIFFGSGEIDQIAG